MRVEVLTVPDCPNGPVARRHLAEALAGRPGVRVEYRVVSTPEEAARYGMQGSPTILIDGRDPFAEPGAAASLSCRLYRDADGRAQGAPSAGELREALAVAECRAGPAGRGGRGRVAPAEGGLRAVLEAVLRSFAATGHAPDRATLEAAAPPGVPADRSACHRTPGARPSTGARGPGRAHQWASAASSSRGARPRCGPGAGCWPGAAHC
jgi:hypothetical protein